MSESNNRCRKPGQSHEAVLLTKLVPISIAPEAQRSLAPRFSVGKGGRQEPLSPEGAAQTAKLPSRYRSCDARMAQSIGFSIPSLSMQRVPHPCDVLAFCRKGGRARTSARGPVNRFLYPFLRACFKNSLCVRARLQSCRRTPENSGPLRDYNELHTRPFLKHAVVTQWVPHPFHSSIVERVGTHEPQHPPPNSPQMPHGRSPDRSKPPKSEIASRRPANLPAC
jgi:hypothetical protein